eukprot:NODE_4853_length_1838_cov_5.710695.p1 GENE.NODE_4853_length_1838_cov_5.710695~~NODE_4853_length_1838_cov_5.710695.p1  ORF type:complete len:505 (-),score=119.17 NODE_4853_length_1838_cov_5.710695:262-1776(-)
MDSFAGEPLLERQAVASPAQSGAFRIGIIVFCACCLVDVGLKCSKSAPDHAGFLDLAALTAKGGGAASENGPMTRQVLLTILLRLAGVGQLDLCVISLAIPFILDWEGQFAQMKLLLKQEFYVYAVYIWGINLSFGLLSALAPASLIDRSFLPAVVSAFIFVYWAARVGIQSFVFDLSHMSKAHEVLGRRGIEVLFVYLSLVYGAAFAHDMGFLSLQERLPDVGPIGRMLLIIGGLFVLIKIVVASMGKGPKMSRLGSFIFFCIWPGMRPSTLVERKRDLAWIRDAGWGCLFIAVGMAICRGVGLAIAAGWAAESMGFAALPAISFVSHVGIFRVLRGALHIAGFDVEQLFVDPLLAGSLSDFWGKRWNVAFSDMNRAIVVAPLRSALKEFLGVEGSAAFHIGLAASFVASALLHELGITVPAGGGYGGPSLYFLLHGALVLLEKQPRVDEFLRRFPGLARTFTIAAVLLPLPLLFGVPFRTRIALPVALFLDDLQLRVIQVFQ